MTAVRPPIWPQVQPTQTPARNAAQRAFFEAALGKAAETATQPIRSEPLRQAQPDAAPQKILRPGSLLDIKV